MEIVFNFDNFSAVWAFVATVIFALIAFLRGMSLSDNKRLRWPKFIRNWTIVWIILFALGSGVSWTISSSSKPNGAATLHDALEQYDVQHGQPTPLYLGGTSVTVSGHAEAHGGIFSAGAVIDLKPTTVVNIGYEHGERWWPIALPAATSPFIKTAENPSVTTWFKDVKLESGEAYWDNTWSECTVVLDNLWLTCQRTIVESKLVVSDAWLNQSPVDFFEKYFERAEIALLPEQLEIIFPIH